MMRRLVVFTGSFADHTGLDDGHTPYRIEYTSNPPAVRWLGARAIDPDYSGATGLASASGH